MNQYILMAVVGAFLVGCNEIFNKHLSENMPNKFLQIAGNDFCSAGWTGLLIYIFVKSKAYLADDYFYQLDWKFSQTFWLAILLVAALNIVIRFCDFKSYEKEAISKVIQIKGITIIALMFMGWIILKENLNFWGICGMLLIFIGTWILGIDRNNPLTFKSPFVNLFKNASVRYALTAALIASVTITLEKLGVINVSPAGQNATMKIFFLKISFAALCGTFVFKFSMATMGLIIGLFWERKINPVVPRMDFKELWWRFIISGFFSASHQWFLFSSYLGLQAAYVGGIKRLSILFTVLLAFLIFGEKQRIQKLISAAIIIAGVGIISFLGK